MSVSCKPELNNKITIELSSPQEINQYDSINGTTYTAEDFEADKEKTLSIIKERLNHIGLFFGDDQFVQDSLSSSRYTIMLPEKIIWDKVQDLITNPGKMEIWSVYKSQEFYNIISYDILKENQIEDKVIWTNSDYAMDGVGLVSTEDTAIVMNTLRKLITNQQIQLRWGHKTKYNADQSSSDKIALYALKKKSYRDGPLITGEYITKAYPETSNYNDKYYVTVKMNDEGAKKWAKITEENIGNPLALVANDEVYSVPMVTSKIERGTTMISGDFSEQEAGDLAINIQWGNLPLKVEIICMTSKRNKTIH